MAEVEEECLHEFVFERKEKVLKLLPKLRSPDTIRNRSLVDATLVHHAASNDWQDVCKLLVEEYNCQPTSVSDSLSSPLHYAYSYGNEATVKYLLSLPSVLRTINDKNKWGNTPLHNACGNGHFAVIEILLESNSVNITEENDEGLTPIDMLRNYCYDKLARLANKIDWRTQLLVKSFFNVFLMGNSAAGKSTLAAVMLELTRDAPTQHGRISNVEKLTAGVVPTQCKG